MKKFYKNLAICAAIIIGFALVITGWILLLHYWDAERWQRPVFFPTNVEKVSQKDLA